MSADEGEKWLKVANAIINGRVSILKVFSRAGRPVFSCTSNHAQVTDSWILHCVCVLCMVYSLQKKRKTFARFPLHVATSALNFKVK